MQHQCCTSRVPAKYEYSASAVLAQHQHSTRTPSIAPSVYCYRITVVLVQSHIGPSIVPVQYRWGTSAIPVEHRCSTSVASVQYQRSTIAVPVEPAHHHYSISEALVHCQCGTLLVPAYYRGCISQCVNSPGMVSPSIVRHQCSICIVAVHYQYNISV